MHVAHVSAQSQCKFPTLFSHQAENDELALKEEPRIEFSGEEGQGRFLDLHEHYHAYINSKFGQSKEQPPKEYQEYVTSVTDFASAPRQQRISKQYRQVATSLDPAHDSMRMCVCGGIKTHSKCDLISKNTSITIICLWKSCCTGFMHYPLFLAHRVWCSLQGLPCQLCVFA